MYTHYALYLIGLLVGVLLGLAFPFLASWWLALGVLAIIVGTELIGWWGFGSEHWAEYRRSFYALYPAIALFVAVGILLGSGAIGTALVTLGKLIS